MDKVTVTQADREAAIKAHGSGWKVSLDEAAEHFARHRIEATRQAEEQIKLLREALEPFAAMGQVMETRATITFGKMPKDSEIVCESSGEAGMGILTMGHFRDAAALLPEAPGWGGVYKPLPRQALEATNG